MAELQASLWARLKHWAGRWRISPLGQRLLWQGGLASVVLTLLAGGLQLHAEYRRDRQWVEYRLHEMEQSTLNSLANSLWNYDLVQLRLLAQGLLKLPAVAAVDVETVAGEHYRFQPQENQTWQPPGLPRVYPLYHGARGEKLGQLRLYLSFDELNAQLWDTARVVFFTQAIKTLLLAVVLLALFHRLVTAHLQRMADYTRHLDFSRMDHPLILHRPASPRMDELDWVVQAVNQLRERFAAELQARTAVEESLFAEKELLQVTLESIGDAVITTDQAAKVRYLNPVAEMLTGWRWAEAQGRDIAEVFDVRHEVTRELIPMPVHRAMQEGRVVGLSSQCMLCNRFGQEYFIEDSAAPIRSRLGQIEGSVLVFRDVTEARTLERRMLHQATHDPLTGLPNRILFLEQMTQALSRAAEQQTMVAVLFLDLDRFKNVNDSLGHLIGDRLLQQVGLRIQTVMHGLGLMSRQGGDEFLLAHLDVHDIEPVHRLAEALLTKLGEPFQVEGNELLITPSIGVSLYPRDGHDIQELIKSADAAMYTAKNHGRNTYRFFTEDLHANLMERLELERGLRHALEQAQFRLYYQPKIDVRVGRIVGAEALIRWQHPELGLVPPIKFIPLLEDNGMIVPIGMWVIEQACRQLLAWQAQGLQPLKISVNLSVVQFRHKGLLAQLREVLQRYAVNPAWLEFEITESVIMQDVEAMIALLNEIKALGVSLSIDDFGTGYSSLNYLKRFPIDTLKIDQSFVRDIHHDAGDAAITLAIISLSHNLNLDVIAEGVETLDHVRFLHEHRCWRMQGYHFSPPVPEPQFTRLLQEQEAQGRLPWVLE